MIHFVVIAGSPTAVGRLAPRLAGAVADTRLFDGEPASYLSPSSSWAVAATCVRDPVCADRLHIEGESMVVLNGPVLAKDARQSTLTIDAMERFRAGGSSAVAQGLGGSYNFVGIDPAIGLRAFADFSGLTPVYWSTAPGVAVFSNRSTTVAAAVGRRGFDVRNLGWVMGHSNLFGDEMPANGVAFLRAGLEAKATWRSGRVVVEPSPEWIWPAPDSDGGRDDLRAAEWDGIVDDLVSSFRSVGDIAPRLVLRLSGGKDSRVCLALAKAAGLQESVQALTSGRDDNPEVACAAEVAKIGGFAHRHVGPVGRLASSVTPDSGFEAALEWERLRQSLYRYEEIVCPWDGTCSPQMGTVLFVTGFGGELYRGPGGHAKRFKRRQPANVDEMAEMFVDYHQVHDPLGLLAAAENDFQAEWLTEWVHAAVDEIRFDLLPEKFFVDYRMGHWNGPLGQSKPGRINVNPLLSASVARKITELDLSVRATERFHFEVLWRTAPELLTVPFVGDTWAPEIHERSPVLLPKEPFPVERKPTTRLMKSWQWPFLETQTAEIEDVVVEAKRETAFGELCDVRRLRHAIRRAGSFNNNVKGKALISALGVAMTLLGRAEPFVDQPIPPVRPG
jgi:hypothetical protein